MEKTPIIYKASILPRFNDFDPYGHVNASCYYDYLVTSRWAFTQKRFQLSAADFVEMGYGFYLTRLEMDFKRPISAKAGEVMVSSFVAEINAELLLRVNFRLTDTSEAKGYASGDAWFAPIDMKTGRKCALPTELEKFFME